MQAAERDTTRLGHALPISMIELLRTRAAAAPHDVALVAPERSGATYGLLHEHVRSQSSALRAHGIGVRDRVALVVRNGPEAASAFLAIGSAAVCAPLNPSYRAEELDFYLTDLRARAVVVGAGLETPARDVARRLGIDVIELEAVASSPAGVFALDCAAGTEEITDPGPDAELLVLHTSGTTARPKIVPLLHRNLTASAGNVAATLALRPADRCLNVMPLFHIHGLVAALLASLQAGGSVGCTPGFHQLRFFDWLRELRPTWTTAVPTMHQAVLDRARRDPSLVRGHTLRLVRSSSAALPVTVLEGLEEVLGVPVVEAYGMTEAAHQMASNPLPPARRRPGSVGPSGGPELAILDADGHLVPPGEVGEVAIRGENVFEGYESNPDANAQAFTNGWFRTGDEGHLDDDGYLVLHGRLKEIINRAGEKVSPLEIDEILLRHPAVARAVTFGVPHDRLGEEVGAAVVTRDGVTVTERELQDFVAQTAAPFKVPRRIVLVDEIPTGPTGKLQRIGLAARLDLDSMIDEGELWTRVLEDDIASIWGDVLEVNEVGPLDDFFALGGDSILGAEAVARLRELIGDPDLPLVTIVRASSPRAMAAEIRSVQSWGGHGVIPIQPGTGERPVFLVPGVDGEMVRFVGLARALGPARPVYGLQAPGYGAHEDPPTDIEGLARDYLAGIRAAQPVGPYLLVSYCMGSAILLEIAHTLEAAGESVWLVLVDPRLQRPQSLRYSLWLVRPGPGLRRRLGAFRRRVLRRSEQPTAVPAPNRGPVWDALEVARERYTCRPTHAPVALVTSGDYADNLEMPDWYLRSVFRRIVSRDTVPGRHVDALRTPALESVADAVGRALTHAETA